MTGLIRFFKKAGVFIVGITVVIIGIILLPLPGPGMLIIAGGLLILSTEFAWAERHLVNVKKGLNKMVDVVKRQDNDKR